MSDNNSKVIASGGAAPARHRSLMWWWAPLARRHPFVAFFIVIIVPNAIWSVANLLYNQKLIVEIHCDEAQKDAFEIAVPIYSTVPWIAGMWVCARLIQPLRAYWRALEGRQPMTAGLKAAAQQCLVNLPWKQLLVNFLLWMPGGLFFPLMIFVFGGTEDWTWILIQFLASFFVSAFVTTFQTYVFLERLLVKYIYPWVFTDVRPVDVPGAFLVSFQVRLSLVWGAVSLGPIIVLVPIVANLLWLSESDIWGLLPLTVAVVVLCVVIGGSVFYGVGKDLSDWLDTHVAATREIARENFDVRIAELRSDDWGRLTDSFNKMAQDLSQGRRVYETMGHFFPPAVRDEILQGPASLGGNVQEITVMFADIRGFTRRSADHTPEEMVELLNRFLSLAVQAIEGKGGLVPKFLGDGFMALFGTPLPCLDHADRAVAAGLDFLKRLEDLNRDLEKQGRLGIKVGIGIHTGSAVVGRIGATLPMAGGRERLRLEWTAIGETVNITQRLEELTKTCGKTLLFSEATLRRLQQPLRTICVGPQEIRGGKGSVVVYTLDA